MAAVTFHEASFGLFIKALDALSQMLTKAKEHNPTGADSYLSMRLYEDMLPLTFQVQFTCNTSKKALERLAPHKGPFPVFADDEKTVDELLARVEKTKALLEAVGPEDLEGREDQVVEVMLGSHGSATVQGKWYALGYALPNIMFHTSMAYAILRNQGVPLGKTDFLSPYFNPYIIDRKPPAKA